MNTSKSNVTTLAPKPTQKNGEQPKDLTPKTPVSIPTITPEKRESAESKLPPIEVRLKKLLKIQQLADRRETLLDAIENLQGFYVTPDGNGCNLRFSDSKGHTFGIAHPIVIGEMVSLAKSKLTAELDKIENQIDFSLA